MVGPRRHLAIGSVVAWALACAACSTGAGRSPAAGPAAPPSGAPPVAASPRAVPERAASGEPSPSTTETRRPDTPPVAVAPTAPPPAEAVAAPSIVEPPPCPKDSRDPRQKPEHVVQLMQLSDAMTVVDVGSGSGYFLCWLSRAVGAQGRVIATEIDSALLRDLERRVERERLANVEVIRAPSNDVGVAAGAADRILVVNV